MRFSIKEEFSYIFDAFMRYTSFFGSPFFIGFVFAFLLVLGQYAFAFKLAIASAVFLIIQYSMKAALNDPRPDFKLIHPHSLFARFEEKHSFPSGHAGYVALLTTMLQLTYQNILLTSLFVAIMFCVGISRMYLKRHRLSDVIVGYILGIVVGYVIFMIL